LVGITACHCRFYLLEPSVKFRHVPCDALKDHADLPHEDSAVPVVAAFGQVRCGRLLIGLLYETIHPEARRISPRSRTCMNIAVTGLWSCRLDAGGHEKLTLP